MSCGVGIFTKSYVLGKGIEVIKATSTVHVRSDLVHYN